MDREEDASIACSLEAAAMARRLAEISVLARRHLVSERLDGSELRLRYAPEALPELRRVGDAERECCRFMSFDLRADAEGAELAIRAPEGAGALAPLLFEHFRGRGGAAPFGCGAKSCGCA